MGADVKASCSLPLHPLPSSSTSNPISPSPSKPTPLTTPSAASCPNPPLMAPSIQCVITHASFQVLNSTTPFMIKNSWQWWQGLNNGGCMLKEPGFQCKYSQIIKTSSISLQQGQHPDAIPDGLPPWLHMTTQSLTGVVQRTARPMPSPEGPTIVPPPSPPFVRTLKRKAS